MKKLIPQFLLFIGVFFGLWYAFSHIPWVKTFHIREFTKEKQEQISELILKMQRMNKQEVEHEDIAGLVRDIKNKLCLANGIDTGTIHTYVFVDAEVNAFAIPGGNIIINSSLICYCDDADMLAGVLAHEIAHIQHDHVTKKLAKEIGITTIATMTGDNNFGIIKKILQTLTSSKFDRSQEREADATGVKYLMKANIDPSALAVFFDKMGKKAGGDMPEAMDWVSTHPNSKERAKEIRTIARKSDNYVPAADSTAWSRACEELPPADNSYEYN